MIMNRIVSLALLMLIVLSQAACGDSADGDVTTSSDTSSEVSDGTTAPEYDSPTSTGAGTLLLY